MNTDLKPKFFDKENEQKICGVNAVKMVFEKRPQDVVKMYIDQNITKEFSTELKILAQNKRGYDVVPNADLKKISGSEHHEGVVIVCKKRPFTKFDQFLKTYTTGLVVVLENVKNPNNVGAILRSAANFGVKAVLFNDEAPMKMPSTFRVSEGGIEALEMVHAPFLLEAIKKLKSQKIQILATSSHANTFPLYTYKWSGKEALLIGEEEKGLSKDLLNETSLKLRIPGTNNVESLNVSVASGILFSEYYRTVIK